MAFPVRDRGFGPPPMYRMTEGVKWLLIVNTALFILYFLTAGTSFGQIFLPLGLVPKSVLGSFAIWQLFTYLFLHNPFGFGHILINMLTLWMFGTALESVWGTRRFLQYYFFCGVGAGICVVLLNALFGSLNTRTIGASGAIYGLLLAFGMLFPDVEILFMFIFPIRARWFVIIMGAIVFLSTLREAGGEVSHFAHLGGMLFGYIWFKSSLGAGRSSARSRRVSLTSRIEQQYQEWKLRRAKKKFQVYLKKHGTRRPDDWVQ